MESLHKIQFEDDLLPIENKLAEIITATFSHIDEPVLIAVGGAGGTGKSTLSKKLAIALGDADVLPLDEYKTCRSLRKRKGIFGAHPHANEMALITEHLARLKSGLSVDKPVYCSKVGRSQQTEKFLVRRYNIIEGEVATYKEFKEIMDFHIYIHSDLTTQLKTRLTRDIKHKGYSRQKAFATFFGSNLIEFTEYGLSSKGWADIILYCDSQYSLSIQHIFS